MMKKMVFTIICFIMILIGWFGNEFAGKASAATTIEYKVVLAQEQVMSGKGLQDLLNTYAKEGWKLNPWGPAGFLIFER
jgi:hypothetical protein